MDFPDGSSMGSTVVVDSHFQRIGCQPEKLHYSVANPARGLLSRETRKKARTSGSAPLPPSRCSCGENKTKIKHRARTAQKEKKIQFTRRVSRDASTCLDPTQVSVHLAPVQDSVGSSKQASRCHFAGSTLPCTIEMLPVQLNLFSPGDSRIYLLFSPRGNNPPPTLRDRLIPHHSPKAVSFRSHSMSNARTSLCTQSVHSFSILPRPLHTTLLRVSNIIFCGNRPPLVRIVPPPTKSSGAQRRLNTLPPGYFESTVERGRPMVWSPVLCASKISWCTVRSRVGVLAKSPRTSFI